MALAERAEYEPSALDPQAKPPRSTDAAPPLPRLPTRLPIDRAFHLKGLGVIVTGTLASGAIRSGDTLEVLPGSEKVRVRIIRSTANRARWRRRESALRSRSPVCRSKRSRAG